MGGDIASGPGADQRLAAIRSTLRLPRIRLSCRSQCGPRFCFPCLPKRARLPGIGPEAGEADRARGGHAAGRSRSSICPPASSTAPTGRRLIDARGRAHRHRHRSMCSTICRRATSASPIACAARTTRAMIELVFFHADERLSDAHAAAGLEAPRQRARRTLQRQAADAASGLRPRAGRSGEPAAARAGLCA